MTWLLTALGVVAVAPAVLLGAPRLLRSPAARVPALGITVVIAAAAVGLVAATVAPPIVAALIATTFWLLLAAAVVDVLERRLPDLLTLPAAAVAVLGLGGVAVVEGGPWLRVLAGAALFAAALFALGLMTGGAGLGDVKAAVSVGAVLGWHGWPAWFTGVLAGLLLLVLVAGLLGLRRGTPRVESLPFGPAMLTGAVLALLVPGT